MVDIIEKLGTTLEVNFLDIFLKVLFLLKPKTCAQKTLGYDSTDKDVSSAYALRLEGQSLNEVIPNYESSFNGGEGLLG